MSALQYNGHILHANYIMPPSWCRSAFFHQMHYQSKWPGQPITKNTWPHQNQTTWKLNRLHQHPSCQLGYKIPTLQIKLPQLCLTSIYTSHVPLLAFFFHCSTALSGPTPPHFQGFVITLS